MSFGEAGGTTCRGSPLDTPILVGAVHAASVLVRQINGQRNDGCTENDPPWLNIAQELRVQSSAEKQFQKSSTRWGAQRGRRAPFAPKTPQIEQSPVVLSIGTAGLRCPALTLRGSVYLLVTRQGPATSAAFGSGRADPVS